MEKHTHPHEPAGRAESRGAPPDTSRREAHSDRLLPAAEHRSRWVFYGFLALAAFFLVLEHRAHVLGFLPWLILLLCPLMHVFMHGGHGHGGHGDHTRTSRKDASEGDDR